MTSLELFGNRIGNEGTIAIGSALRNNKVLKALYLGVNSIGPEGAKSLANALPFNRALTILNLFNNNIKDEGAMAFSVTLRRNDKLATLALQGNSIGAAAMDAVSTILKVPAGERMLHFSKEQEGERERQRILAAENERQAMQEQILRAAQAEKAQREQAFKRQQEEYTRSPHFGKDDVELGELLAAKKERLASAAPSGPASPPAILGWLSRHGLSATVHWPMLKSIGVQQLTDIPPLKMLSFADLSAELKSSGIQGSAAERAAIYQALHATDKDEL